MAKRAVYNNFNRGEVSSGALCRNDVKFINESAELIDNFLPDRLGGMSFRPGTGYIGTLLGASYFVPFTRSIGDQALLEFSNNKLRVWVDDAIVSRRDVNAASALSALSAWMLYGAGATYGSSVISVLAASGGRCDAFNSVSLHTDDRNVEIGITFTITDGPLEVRIGSTNAVLANDLFQGWLNPGTYSFAVTSSQYIAVTVSSDKDYAGKLSNCQIEDNVNLELTTTITTAMLPTIRVAQVNDVLFVASDDGNSPNTQPMYKVMRFGEKSWGIAAVRSDDGPFREINIGVITMAPAALTGDTTLTASAAFFKSTHVGALMRVASKGQLVTQSFTAVSQSSGSIKVTGTGAARYFNFTRTVVGLWGGVTTLALQQSTDDATWTDYSTYITGVGTLTINDGLDNQTMYYRLYTNAWDGNPSQIDTTLNYPGGSILGTCRVTSYTSSTVVNIQVLESFGSTTASDNWYEGAWSGKRGYPTAVAMYEGRLWFAGIGQVWGSVSDAYESFDRDVVGDSASVYRSIAFESSANVHWMGEAQRLLCGITRDEISIRSSSFNEIVTPTNANLKGGSGVGADDIDCIASNGSLYFVARTGNKVIRLDYNGSTDGYQVNDLHVFNETICNGSDSLGIKRIAHVRLPIERLLVLLNDGSVRVFTVDVDQEVAGWSRVSTYTGHTFTDIFTIPGDEEDRVYLVAYRGSSYYLEKMALSSDAVGGAASYHVDSYVYAAGPTTSVSCAHIPNSTTVAVWANGVNLGNIAVDAGAVALGGTYSNVTVGYQYSARYKSNKITGFAPYSTLTERAKIEDVGIIASNVVVGSMSYGIDFDNLVSLPGIEDRAAISTTTATSWMDYQPYTFRGQFKTDSRVCLKSLAPATIHCLTYGVVESKDKQGG